MTELKLYMCIGSIIVVTIPAFESGRPGSSPTGTKFYVTKILIVYLTLVITLIPLWAP